MMSQNQFYPTPPPTEQLEKQFFNPETYPIHVFDRAWWVSSDNPECSFSRFIGNTKAVKRLSRAAYAAMGRPNHVCNDQSFALLGPSSSGKTTLARLFAELLRLPFVEIAPKSINSVDDILFEIARVCESTFVDTPDGRFSLELVPEQPPEGPDYVDNYFFLPPMVVFLDEAHALPDKIVQGLLKATEHNDAILNTTQWRVDCRNVCWIIATTDMGQLFDAFVNRFTKIHLDLYSKAEIAKIVKLSNPDWEDSICNLVAYYCGTVPREALDFAREMRLEAEMRPAEWAEIAKQVAEDSDIDLFGMTYQRLNVLIALNQGPVSRGNLGEFAQCKEEELVRYVMPPLMVVTEDYPEPLVRTSSKGYVLTNAGMAELKKRNIPSKKINQIR